MVPPSLSRVLHPGVCALLPVLGEEGLDFPSMPVLVLAQAYLIFKLLL